MRKNLSKLCLGLVLGGAVPLVSVAADAPAAGGEFTVTSPDIAPGARIADEQVYDGFGCTGKNVSPALAWRNPPAGTQSFAVMVHDPDAPTGSGWWHWVVWNIPADATGLPKGAGSGGAPLPEGAVQGKTDFGSAGYGGPCPPPGDQPHRYFFRVHALKVPKLELPADATAAMVGFNVRANTLAVAELKGTYGR